MLSGMLSHRRPTSEILSDILDTAPEQQATIGWLIDRLGERSFGLSFLMMGFIAFVPGASTFIGILLAWPAIQLMLGRRTPVLPGRIRRREIDLAKLQRASRYVFPTLRALERVIRPRLNRVFRMFQWLIGLSMLLLGLTLISPFPFSHLIPAAVIMLLALAYLEEDGIALCLFLLATTVSIAISVAAVWGGLETLEQFWTP